MQKIPFIIILGDEEQKNKNISLRIHKKGDQGRMTLKEFMKNLNEKIKSKEISYEI